MVVVKRWNKVAAIGEEAPDPNPTDERERVRE